MDSLVTRAAAAATALWEPGDRVAVAVSAGADSTALLHLLVESIGLHGAILSVVTVDHGLRAESSEDARFVIELAESLGLPVHCARVQCGPSEAEAREARYQVLAAVEADWVALAHHADDQVETVLLNLLRGTGPRGLAGMVARRGRYVRPLLGVRGEELRDWLASRNLPFREDSTNQDGRFLRNRIRGELVPLMNHLRPNATRGIPATARLLEEQNELVDSLASALSGPPWSLAHLPHEAVLRRALMRRVHGLQNRHVDAVLRVITVGQGAVALPSGRRAVVRKGQLFLD